MADRGRLPRYRSLAGASTGRRSASPHDRKDTFHGRHSDDVLLLPLRRARLDPRRPLFDENRGTFGSHKVTLPPLGVVTKREDAPPLSTAGGFPEVSLRDRTYWEPLREHLKNFGVRLAL